MDYVGYVEPDLQHEVRAAVYRAEFLERNPGHARPEDFILVATTYVTAQRNDMPIEAMALREAGSNMTRNWARF